MNREGFWGTLSGRDSGTIDGESLIKSKHIGTMVMGCVTDQPSHLPVPCGVSPITHTHADLPPPPFSSPFLAPPNQGPMSTNSALIETSSSTP
jgi:hypothetical protein